MEKRKFTQLTKENLNYYVYCLIDPSNKEIFYVGKGKGDRCFQHELEQPDKNKKKNERINKIKKKGKKPEIRIVYHGMSETEALTLESILITMLNSNKWCKANLLTNMINGHNFKKKIFVTTENLDYLYATEYLDESSIDCNVLIVNINETFRNSFDKSAKEQKEILYDVSRRWWVVSDKIVEKHIKLVFAEYAGVVRAIFEPHKWNQRQKDHRWEFEGKDVTEKYKEQYFNKKLHKKTGCKNPVRYIIKDKNNGTGRL